MWWNKLKDQFPTERTDTNAPSSPKNNLETQRNNFLYRLADVDVIYTEMDRQK